MKVNQYTSNNKTFIFILLQQLRFRLSKIIIFENSVAFYELISDWIDEKNYDTPALPDIFTASLPPSPSPGPSHTASPKSKTIAFWSSSFHFAAERGIEKRKPGSAERKECSAIVNSRRED